MWGKDHQFANSIVRFEGAGTTNLGVRSSNLFGRASWYSSANAVHRTGGSSKPLFPARPCPPLILICLSSTSRCEQEQKTGYRCTPSSESHRALPLPLLQLLSDARSAAAARATVRRCISTHIATKTGPNRIARPNLTELSNFAACLILLDFSHFVGVILAIKPSNG